MSTALNETSLPVLADAEGSNFYIEQEQVTPVSVAGEDLAPDRAEALSFLRAITGEGDPRVTFQTFDDSKTEKRGYLAAVSHGTLDEHFDDLVKRNRIGAGIFVMVNAGRCSGPRRREAVQAIRAAFLDLDGSPIEPVRAALRNTGMTAHVEVESSPGRWHVYIRVMGCPLDQFKAMQQALARPFDGDMAVCDLPRVMRLPGFIHRKGDPYRSRILSTSGHAPYSVAELVRKLDLRPPDRGPSAHAKAVPRSQPSAASEAGEPIPEGERHTRLVSMAGTMRRGGFSAEAIEAAILQAAHECGLATGEAIRIAHDIGARPAPSAAVMTAAAEIAALAALPRLEYEVKRKDTAARLKLRQSALDDLVRSQRPADPASHGSGEAPVFPLDEPWPEPVAVGELLNDVRDFLGRHVIATDASHVAMTLWIAFTWIIDHVECAPILALLSPEKRCGKSTALRAIGGLVRRPLAASNVSAASVFRAVEAWQPTLLLDEADAWLRENEALRGVVNSGHTRDTAYVLRVEQIDDKLVPRRFSTWSPKIIAMIGKPPGTILDRSVPVWLRRKMVSEKVQRLPRAAALAETRQKFARVAVDHGAAIGEADPSMPDGLNDRAADCWQPLLAIADLAGGTWSEAARTAAVALSGEDAAPDEGYGVQLLADLRGIFHERGQDRISTVELLTALNEDGERPWATIHKGRPLEARRLAQMLGSFGIRSKTHRFATATVPDGAGAVFVGEQAKGYARGDFYDAWTRYLQPLQATGCALSVPA